MTDSAEMSSPKVLHVVLSLNVGGAEKLIFDLVRHPLFARRPPAVCCLDAVGELGEKLRAEGYSVHLRNRKSGIDLSMISWLRGIILKERATVVHAHQYTPVFYAVPAALWGGKVPVVYTEHGRLYPDTPNWKKSLVTPLLAHGIDSIVSISEQTAQAMAGIDRFPEHRIRVVHNGVDLARLNPEVDRDAKCRELGLNPKMRFIGTAARLEQIKNIPMMLRAFRLVLKQVPDCCLVIAGQGSESENLKNLAEQMGVADKVRFVGLRFDLAEIYQLLDVFLLSSFTEGISVTLLEAMASGIPAVVTDVGGNGTVVRHGETGFLVPLDADQAMADDVVLLLRDADTAGRSGLEARERVRRDFSMDSMVAAYDSFYRSRSNPV